MDEQTEIAGFVALDAAAQHCLTEAGGDVHEAIRLAKVYIVGAGPLREVARDIALKSVEAATASGASLDASVAALFADPVTSELVDKQEIEDIVTAPPDDDNDNDDD